MLWYVMLCQNKPVMNPNVLFNPRFSSVESMGCQQKLFFENHVAQLEPRTDKPWLEDDCDDWASVIAERDVEDERTLRKCSSYGCWKEFTEEDNEVCFSHFGVWDFGHTGISIQQSLKEMKSGKFETILWPPHWTCCGKGWKDSCGKKHMHRGPAFHKFSKNENFDVEREFESKSIFKKIVRPSWISQVKKFHKYDKGKIKRVIKDFALKYSFEPNVRNLFKHNWQR